MRATLIGLRALAAALVLGGVALAQPRGGRKKPPTPGGLPATSASAPTDIAPSSDIGVIPAPAPQAPSDLRDGGVKSSPLNPAPNEFADSGLISTSIDYDRLLADVASLRARAAAVSDTLFHSRLALSVQTGGDHGRIAGLSIGLDDGTVFTSLPGFRAEDATVVYDHAVAPGHHAVTVEVERRDDRNDAFRSSQRSRFTVDVPGDGLLSLDIKLSDESNMGGDFGHDKRGFYDLRVRAEAKAQPSTKGK
jgi:hypothetical protein